MIMLICQWQLKGVALLCKFVQLFSFNKSFCTDPQHKITMHSPYLSPIPPKTQELCSCGNTFRRPAADRLHGNFTPRVVLTRLRTEVSLFCDGSSLNIGSNPIFTDWFTLPPIKAIVALSADVAPQSQGCA